MNLVDTERTPLFLAFDMVRMEAEARGVSPTWSEIVGLVPERALFDTAARHVQLRDFTPEMVLERCVRAAVEGGESLGGFVASVASPTPAPGGGSVAALAGALAAALAQMVAGLTIGKKKYAAVESEMKEIALQAAALVNQLTALVKRDAEAYNMVMSAHKLPGDNDADAARKKTAVTAALLGAAEVPLETARACVRVLELAAAVAARGNQNAVSDAGVAALLAEAACRGAVYNVRINVASLEDKNKGAKVVDESKKLLALASERVNAVTTMVERAISQ
jgi:glutamate formiminotransferase/formiminotetrahydrofolate cyclodeaminase